MSGDHNVGVLCATLGVSRSGYYAWLQCRAQPCARAQENRTLTEQIRYAFVPHRQSYGSPRIAEALGCPARRNRIARLMHEAGIWARQKSKYRVRTTDSRHGGPIAPNRLPEVRITGPDQAWGREIRG
jgi:putative transposase